MESPPHTSHVSMAHVGAAVAATGSGSRLVGHNDRPPILPRLPATGPCKVPSAEDRSHKESGAYIPDTTATENATKF